MAEEVKRGGAIGNLEKEGGNRQEGTRGTFVFILASAIRCAEENKIKLSTV